MYTRVRPRRSRQTARLVHRRQLNARPLWRDPATGRIPMTRTMRIARRNRLRTRQAISRIHNRRYRNRMRGVLRRSNRMGYIKKGIARAA